MQIKKGKKRELPSQEPLTCQKSGYISILVSLVCYNKIHGLSGFNGSSAVKNLPISAVDTGSVPGSGRSLGEENGSPLRYFCLENPVDKGAWSATFHGITKSWT